MVGIVLGLAASWLLSAIVLPSVRAGSICACRCCIDYGAHRIAFGRRSRETRLARRPGNPAPRTMIFKPEPEKLWQLIRHEQCCEKLHLDHHLRHRATGGSFPNRAILNLSAKLQFPVCQPLCVEFPGLHRSSRRGAGLDRRNSTFRELFGLSYQVYARSTSGCCQAIASARLLDRKSTFCRNSSFGVPQASHLADALQSAQEER